MKKKARVLGLTPGSIIKMKVEENPKRKGTYAFAIFKMYEDGMSISQARDKGIPLSDIKYNLERGFISIDGATIEYYTPETAQQRAERAAARKAAIRFERAKTKIGQKRDQLEKAKEMVTGLESEVASLEADLEALKGAAARG